MPSELEITLYEKAKARALIRAVNNLEMITDSYCSFLDGLRHAHCLDSSGDVLASPISINSRIVTESNAGFAIVCALIAKVEAVKGKGYAAQWQEEGLESGFDNIKRKFGRIRNILERKTDEGGESLTENLGDLVSYGIKMICLQNELNPEEVLRWRLGIRNLK